MPHIEVSEVGGADGGGGGGGVIITSDSIARIRLTGRLLDLAMVVAASFYVFCQQVQEVKDFGYQYFLEMMRAIIYSVELIRFFYNGNLSGK